MSSLCDSCVVLAQEKINEILQHGDIALDATIGNGKDTLFLANKVGRLGRVWGFDIQKEAIKKTGELLAKNQIQTNLTLIEDSHENLDLHLPKEMKGKVQAIMFNLGYLPGRDKKIVTRTPSTLLAIEKALSYLSPKGMMTITCYPGHPEGEEEAIAVRNYLRKQEGLSIEDFSNRKTLKKGPELFIVQRDLPSGT